MTRRKTKGFTLIELLVAVAVIGILAAIAFPSYQSSIRKSNRGAAQAFIMDVAQREQAFLLDNRSYAAVANNAAFPAALGIGVPAEVANRYDIVVTTANAPPRFTITATAKGNQLEDGNLVFQSDGTKTRAGDPAKW